MEGYRRECLRETLHDAADALRIVAEELRASRPDALALHPCDVLGACMHALQALSDYWLYDPQPALLAVPSFLARAIDLAAAADQETGLDVSGINWIAQELAWAADAMCVAPDSA